MDHNLPDWCSGMLLPGRHGLGVAYPGQPRIHDVRQLPVPGLPVQAVQDSVQLRRKPLLPSGQRDIHNLQAVTHWQAMQQVAGLVQKEECEVLLS